MNIADLHCDLLAYLAEKEGRSAQDEESRCSLPQLQRGGVILQTLAVFTETGKKSVALAEKQFRIFQNLPKKHPQGFTHSNKMGMPEASGKIHIVAAIENASGLCGEQEDLDNCFARFDSYRDVASPILYISLTWNQENRFGGGNQSKAGLKRDGELLLEYLDGKGIAVDLSHTSDALANEILNFIDKKGLQLIPIASHSNFRKITNQQRNLPDMLAKEIFQRGGVVGMNFFKPFVGKHFPEDFQRQIDYGRSLGGFDQICLGADFFHLTEVPTSLQSYVSLFYERFGNAGCYPDYLDFLSDVYTTAELEKVTHKNLANFFGRIHDVARR